FTVVGDRAGSLRRDDPINARARGADGLSQSIGGKCGISFGRAKRGGSALTIAASRSDNSSLRSRYLDRFGQGLRSQSTSSVPVSFLSTYATRREPSECARERSQMRQALRPRGSTSHADAGFGGSGAVMVIVL